jgi:hypothetical protein
VIRTLQICPSEAAHRKECGVRHNERDDEGVTRKAKAENAEKTSFVAGCAWKVGRVAHRTCRLPQLST